MMKKQTLALGILASSVLAAPALAQFPKLQPDGAWIAISGTVVSPGDDEFTLDYGHGQISVEMDDWEWYADSIPVLAGDTVTVYGEVEQHLFVDASIEADSVFVQGMGTYFYATAPQDRPEFMVMDVTPVTPVVVGNVSFTGTVSDVSGREFTLSTGGRSLTVDNLGMPYNPMDDEGLQKVEVGDVVSVAGNLGTDLIGDRELTADSVVIIQDESMR